MKYLIKNIFRKSFLKCLVRYYKNSIIYKRILRHKLVRLSPSFINIEMTNKFNLKCWFCPHSHLKLKFESIEWKTFEKFIKDLKELDTISEIVPVGLGEPFLYSHWQKAFETIKIQFPNVPLRLVSNGTLINQKICEAICKLFNNNDSILISVNTLNKEIYKKMMGYDYSEKVIANIINLINIRKKTGKKFSIKTQLLVTTKTEDQKNSFQKFWSVYLKESNDVPLYLRELENWGGLIETNDNTNVERYPCLSLWSIVVIDMKGNAYPCCEALATREKSDLLLGNIMENRIKDIYSSKKYLELREKHLSCDWNSIKDCEKCDFWKSSPNIWIKTKNGFK